MATTTITAAKLFSVDGLVAVVTGGGTGISTPIISIISKAHDF
jgi:hypothetical protein